MSAELALGTPLADALNGAIQNKIADLGWAGGSSEGAAMSEYFILMLINGKTADDISSEISGELLGLGPEDQTAPAFAQWLIEQYHTLAAQMAQSGPTGASAETSQDDAMDASFDQNMDTTDTSAGELNAPTGPRAMRAGGNIRGRDKRMMGQINRALDRSHDSVLHRTRGQSGISRGPPTGPRMNAGRQPRVNNMRPANVAAGLAAGMGAVPVGPPGMNPMNGMNGMHGMPGMNGGFAPPELLAIMEQQNQMLQQMQQQLMMQTTMGNGRGHHGKPFSDRGGRTNNFRRGGGSYQQNGHGQQQHQQQSDAVQPETTGQQGEDVEMSQGKKELPNPEETVCKFNLRCTNKDCKFAHQSPVAPPNTVIDVKDVCSFGAACKNRKCVGRHPSPANKTFHQSEQDCKFYPNCTNPNCPFRHPSMPPCRNGGECKVPNCKFTHIKTACKFNPCTNRNCPFTHEEGQRGTFKDKVWVADEHVSERKFVKEGEDEELILPGHDVADEGMPEVIV
ncbi:hypothetical protein QBC47DRAFT_388268 [Echria macrotheca]|uniref:Nab2-like CCCH zinc finger domain-containing protein n=1 Tax=Echria macrotheca TaxID=438768 RepID=A0AAJ0B637_9PEZI|nr:hypothetical protein QBC47DRAFT_388268 [Echria macrotheca]